jgi:hypothetical protein
MATQTPARETAGHRPAAATATARLSAYGPSELLQAGAVAGLVAGLGFILANMIYATSQGLPAIAPFLAIGTIFFIDDMPQMTPAYGLALYVVNFLVLGNLLDLRVVRARRWRTGPDLRADRPSRRCAPLVRRA